MNSDNEKRIETLGKLNVEFKGDKYNWDLEVQSRILGLLLSEKTVLVQSLGLVQSNYFASESYEIIASCLFSYYGKYNELPTKWALREEVSSRLKERQESVRLYYLSTLDSLYDFYVPGLETREYLLNKILTFAKRQSMKLALYEALKKLSETEEKDVDKNLPWIYERLNKAMTLDINYDVGLELFKNLDEFYELARRRNEGQDTFTTGFHYIDQTFKSKGLLRGEIGAWIASPGVGKSLCLCKGSVANVNQDRKVMYISMEMDRVSVASRFLAQFARVSGEKLCDPEVESMVRKSVAHFLEGRNEQNPLIIKQFPMGAIDVNGIKGYYTSVKTRGWKPDLLIIDYPGEMKHNPLKKTHESAYEILRDLRGFGVEEQHCTLTCIQPNRSASQLEIHQFIDESSIGSSYDQFKPLDALWSINQTMAEKTAEVARGYVIKTRDGKSKVLFKMGFDYNAGTLDVFDLSNESYNDRMNRMKEEVSSEVPLDKVNIKPNKRKGRSVSGFDPHSPDEENT